MTKSRSKPRKAGVYLVTIDNCVEETGLESVAAAESWINDYFTDGSNAEVEIYQRIKVGRVETKVTWE
jgi:hypothetical protein